MPIQLLKKVLTLFILLTLTVPLLLTNFPVVFSASSFNSMSDCEKAYDAKYPGQNPPNGIKCIIRQNGPPVYLFFNPKLYRDLQVIAYGTPESANGPSDFKTYWQDLQGNTHTERIGNHPYFNKDGEAGEYRYYGWDVNGNLYTNIYFPNDANNGLDPNLKHYIYHPWSSSLLNGNSNKPASFGPFWSGNKYGIRGPENIYQNGPSFVATVNNIIKSSQVTVKYQAKDSVTDPHSPKNLFDYMYVQQAPTTQAPGSGRLYHVNADGRVWYQSYPIDRQTNKERLGVQAAIIEKDPKAGFKTDLAKLPDRFIWTWQLGGEIPDDDYIASEFDRTRYYTRFDIEKWELDVTYAYPGGTKSETLLSTRNGELAIRDKKKAVTRNPDLSITLDKTKIKKGDKLVLTLTAKAYYYGNDQPDVGSVTRTYTFDGNPPEEDLTPPLEPPDDGPPPLVCQPNIPGDAFDIVPFGASDGTDLSRIDGRTVSVDGVPVDADLFWNGQYVFGDGTEGLHVVSVKWTPKPGADKNGADMCDTWRLVNVHNTKPRAQFKLYGGTFKENRKMSVDNTSSAPDANDPLVLATYPIVSAEWTWSAVDGSDADRRMKIDDPDHKEFLYKKPGEYRLSLTVTNALGRTSDPYVLPFSVIPDEAPAIILYPYASQISRTESLTTFFDAVSTDGDIVKNEHFDVYYDVGGDETYTQLIDSFDGPVSQYRPKGDKLGKYRIVATVDEDFGQETFPEFITAADRRISTAQFEFEVDNYIPYADIYTDIPSIRQQVDTAILLDKNLAQSKIDYVKSNGVTISNQMRYQGIDPNVSVWDMHTYTYSQPASTVRNTGSYPPSTYSYCAGGYCGTLALQSASDNGSYHDFGHYETVVDVPAHTETVVDVPGHYETVVDQPGHYETRQIPWCLSSKGDHPPPCEYGSNATTKTEYYWVPTTYKQVWVPTTYRTINVPATYKQVWVSDIRWVSNWYGTYAGTIYKDVRQPYSNPYARATADRYLIYISDGGIGELADFNKVKGLSDAKIVLVGTQAIRSQTNYDHFIANTGQPIEDLIQSVVDYIASNNPPAASQTVLVGQTFRMLTDETDPENDPIVQKQTMYVHDENYYDNPMGHAAFALNEYDPDGWTNETLRTSFAQTGEYKIYRRVQDQPDADPSLAKYRYWSNEPYTVVRVHRKPIAQAELDWTYDASCSCYQTDWVDRSYDLDHNISDPVHKGIVARKIRYQTGGEWYYQVPDRLAPGAYHLEYVVQDVEGAWSDPFTLDFQLASSPPPQLKASLKPADDAFALGSGVPAGEDLRAYDLWTRYPYSVDLKFTMGSFIQRTVPYFTGNKTGSDIAWDDVLTSIPATTPDGDYTYQIAAIGTGGYTASRDFTVKVRTPIRLRPSIRGPDGTEAPAVVVGQPIRLAAQTTEYPNQVTVVAFKGTSYQKTVALSGAVVSRTGEGEQDWTASWTPAGAIPDGPYLFEWTARTPNGNTETKTLTVQVVNNTPPFGDFSVYTYDRDRPDMPIFEGDTIRIRTIGLGDRERDPLTIRYEIYQPDGDKKADQTVSAVFPYDVVAEPSLRLPDGPGADGVWTVRQSISDGKAPPVVRERTLVVRRLGIQGTVSHTDAWEENRLQYNAKYPDHPRPPDWFWAGEAFVLTATVTDTGSSGTKPVSVEADAGPPLVRSLSAAGGDRSLWTALLTGEDAGQPLEKLPKGPYTFVFKVTYSNGVVRTDQATVRLQDTVDQFLRVHRVR